MYSKVVVVYISSVQLLSCVQLLVTPWTAACQASLSITSSWSLLKLMSIELVMPSSRLTLCHPLLLLPSIFPSIRVFSNESVLHIRWPKYWSSASASQTEVREVLQLCFEASLFPRDRSFALKIVKGTEDPTSTP